jgi:hypothetical protein
MFLFQPIEESARLGMTLAQAFEKVSVFLRMVEALGTVSR